MGDNVYQMGKPRLRQIQCYTCCQSWEGKGNTVASPVHENHRFLDKVDIYPSWIKHVKPTQDLSIISLLSATIHIW